MRYMLATLIGISNYFSTCCFKNTLISLPNDNNSLISLVRELHKWPCQNKTTTLAVVFLFCFPILARVRKLGGKTRTCFANLRTVKNKRLEI